VTNLGANGSRPSCCESDIHDFRPPAHIIAYTTTMMRPTNSLRLFQAVKPGSQQMRCLSTTASQRVADPRDQPASHRMESTEDQVSIVEAEQKPKGSVKEFHPEHQPDYRAHVDHGTGLYSPVPRKVQDGSEPGETLAAAVLSGAPVDLQARTVR